ncbi:MAG: 2'-5' RNA ligase family protein [Pyrinomonadaceae bacterium]
MPETRRQATLFVRHVPAVESIRRTFNPKQAELISAHVTLCREDEVKDWDLLAAKLEKVTFAVTLEFGSPVRDGDLVFLPGIDIDGTFRDLRTYLLGTDPVRDHEPHITLIHPRNGRCTDDIWEAIRTGIKPFTYTFHEVSFILQQGGGLWQTLQDFPLP